MTRPRTGTPLAVALGVAASLMSACGGSTADASQPTHKSSALQPRTVTAPASSLGETCPKAHRPPGAMASSAKLEAARMKMEALARAGNTETKNAIKASALLPALARMRDATPGQNSVAITRDTDALHGLGLRCNQAGSIGRALRTMLPPPS